MNATRRSFFDIFDLAPHDSDAAPVEYPTASSGVAVAVEDDPQPQTHSQTFTQLAPAPLPPPTSMQATQAMPPPLPPPQDISPSPPQSFVSSPFEHSRPLIAPPPQAVPCAACGCAFRWLSPSKEWKCPECFSVPPVAAMVRQRISLLWAGEGGSESFWVDYDEDRERRGLKRTTAAAWRARRG